MPDDIRFCPLLTIVKAGQPNYMVCQANCVFYLDGECAFITTAKLLKDNADSKTNEESKRKKQE
ncbi:hypothetical protein GF312_00715 [Candidatus Poribacteria bacterium]|nr:hypothetical protein [Candidatus Poribacteria bacterium]